MDKQFEIKEQIKQRYGKIALNGNSDSCCNPSPSSSSSSSSSFSLEGCCTTTNTDDIITSAHNSLTTIGYEPERLKAIPESSILGVGCGNPTKFAHIKEGDTVVDLGSGAGIDVFLAANIVKDKGHVIGIDMTEEMLRKAKDNASNYGYKNVEFRQGDIEKRIPVEDNSVDVVISNCVINLTTSKLNTFKEIYRILKPNGLGRMIISDLVTSKEIDEQLIDTKNWCSCIDGALTKENYLDSIKKAGFNGIEILDERSYVDLDLQKEQEIHQKEEKRKITSISVKAIKK